jgi:U3 small nucleolar RNA-associated protein 11
MMSSRAEGGTKIGDRGNKALEHNAVELLKKQDSGYLRTMLQQTRRERERLEQEIQVEEGKVNKVVSVKGGLVDGKKIAFVESREEQEAFLQDAEDDWEDEDDEEETDDDEEPQTAVRKANEVETEAQKEERRQKKKRLRAREVRRNLLEAVQEREEMLAKAEHELEIQRAKMSNSIGGINKHGVKFKVRERKR